jgi:hypothetical protein
MRKREREAALIFSLHVKLFYGFGVELKVRSAEATERMYKTRG